MTAIVFRSALFLALLTPLPWSALSASENASNHDARGWARLRGPQGSGIAAADKEPPLNWGVTDNVLWKTAIEGRGHSSPIVWGDRIFVTTAIEGDAIPGASAPVHTYAGQEFKHPQSLGSNRHHTMKVIAVDALSGEIVWQKTAYAGRVYDDRHARSSYASPTPVTDGERVYAYFGPEGVYAYDLDGEPQWERDIGKVKSVGLGVGSSPILYGRLLIIQADEDSGDDSFIVALDTDTGNDVWRTERPVQASWTTPVLVEHEGKPQLITSGNEFVIGYDPETGREIWRATGLLNNAIHMPLLIDDLVIFTSGYPEKVSFALELGQSGELSADSIAWRYEKGTAYVPSNLLYDGLLYLTNDGGVMTCLDARTGEVIYEGGRADIRGRYTASLVGASGRILMVNEDGDAVWIKAGREYEVLSTNSLDEPVFATPAIVGDRIYIRAASHLYAIGESGG